MAMLWRTAVTAATASARGPLSRPSAAAATTIHGRRAFSSSTQQVNEKDFHSIREELQGKAEEKDITRIREELQRLQISNDHLSRRLIDLQQQVITTAGISVQDPTPPSRHQQEGETGRGGGFLAGSLAHMHGGGHKSNQPHKSRSDQEN